MSPRTSLWTVLALTAALLGPAVSASAQAHERRGPQEQIIDLDFRGGPASAYIAAVRKAAGDVNVMMSPYVEDVPVQPVELRRVSVHAALDLLEGRYNTGGRTVDVGLDVTPARSPNALNVYKLEARVRADREIGASGVWSLVDMLQGDLTAEAALTAIETALELYDKEAYGTAELRYHRESGLLIARAHPDQIDTISELVSRLSRGKSRNTKELQDKLARAAALEDELAVYKAELEGAHRQMMEVMMRTEMLERELEEVRAERRDLQKQLTVTQIERDTQINALHLEINRLKGTVDERNER